MINIIHDLQKDSRCFDSSCNLRINRRSIYISVVILISCSTMLTKILYKYVLLRFMTKVDRFIWIPQVIFDRQDNLSYVLESFGEFESQTILLWSFAIVIWIFRSTDLYWYTYRHRSWKTNILYDTDSSYSFMVLILKTIFCLKKTAYSFWIVSVFIIYFSFCLKRFYIQFELHFNLYFIIIFR